MKYLDWTSSAECKLEPNTYYERKCNDGCCYQTFKTPEEIPDEAYNLLEVKTDKWNGTCIHYIRNLKIKQFKDSLDKELKDLIKE